MKKLLSGLAPFFQSERSLKLRETMESISDRNQWLRGSAGWLTGFGPKGDRKYYPKYKVYFWFEGKECVFKHEPTGKIFQGMMSEVIDTFGSWMAANHYK